MAVSCLLTMFTPSLTPEHATTLKLLSRKHPLSPTLKKEMRLFSDKLVASCKPAMSQKPLCLRLSILPYSSLGVNFPLGAGVTVTTDWTAFPQAEGKLESAGRSPNAHPLSVS